MSDADRLEQEFRSGRLLRPSPDVLNLVDLANATAAVVGAGSRPLTSGAEKIAGMIGPADHLILVAADGLGMALVDSLDADGFMRRHVAASLRTTFPSTTATAFTSLATGQWPNRHAALGWFTYIPDIDAVSTIIPFIRSADGASLTDLGLTIDRALPVPSRASEVDRPLLSLLPTAIAESTFSGYVSGGRPRTGYDAPEEAVASSGAAVLTASGPTYTYLYVPDVDYAGHALGFSDARTLAAAAALERLLEGLAHRLAGRARIVVTADHGGLDADGERVHLLRASDPLVRLLRREPSGDSRAVYFHVREGDEREFEDMFRDRFGDRFFLLTTGEAEEVELFGPGCLSDEVRRRLGTFVALSSGVDVILYDWPTRSEDDQPFVGYHSGLTPAEMLIPLIVA